MNIFKLTLRRLFSSKLRIGVMFLGPILFIALFVLTRSATFTIGIVDLDNSYYSSILIESLSERYKVTMINEDEIAMRISEYQDHHVLKIPKGFEDSLADDHMKTPLTSYFDNQSSMSYAVQEEINGLVHRMSTIIQSSQGDIELSKRIYTSYKDIDFDIISINSNNIVIEQLIASIGFLIQFLLYMAIGTTGILLEDKGNGTYYRNFYAPLKLKRYLFESLLAFIVVAFLQVTVVFIFIGTMLNKNNAALSIGSMLQIYFVMLLFSFVCIALGLLIVNLLKKASTAYSLMGIITTPLVMLGGCYWDKELMPEALNTVGKFLPTTWAMDGIRALASSQSLADILPEIGVLLLFGLCFFVGGFFKKVDVSS